MTKFDTRTWGVKISLNKHGKCISFYVNDAPQTYKIGAFGTVVKCRIVKKTNYNSIIEITKPFDMYNNQGNYLLPHCLKYLLFIHCHYTLYIYTFSTSLYSFNKIIILKICHLSHRRSCIDQERCIQVRMRLYYILERAARGPARK